jgi:hypothetical protein
MISFDPDDLPQPAEQWEAAADRAFSVKQRADAGTAAAASSRRGPLVVPRHSNHVMWCQCGVLFVHERTTAKFCSRRCRQAYRAAGYQRAYRARRKGELAGQSPGVPA